MSRRFAVLLCSLAAAAACAVDDDCNGAGLCVGGSCKCDAGFTGPTCGLIKFGRSYKCGAGGLCLHGQLGATATWGGGVTKSDDGKYHLYGAMMNLNCSLGAWLTNSEVIHAVADAPQGPYSPSDVALGQQQPVTSTWDGLTEHNPTITRAPDGTYLLFYMGSTAVNTTSQNCSHTDGRAKSAVSTNQCTYPEGVPVCNQQIGLATAGSPYGPWKRPTQPILAPGPAGEWDDQFVTNPTVHMFKNGSVLMVYKARSKENFNAMRTGVAFAEHWSGPYVRAKPSTPFDVPADCEDSGMYFSEAMGVFRIVMHCACNYLYLWSRDGYNWKSTTPQQPWCDITYTDNSTETVSRRERPQWVLDSSGRPIFLSNGVEGASTDHGGQTWTMMTEILP